MGSTAQSLADGVEQRLAPRVVDLPVAKIQSVTATGSPFDRRAIMAAVAIAPPVERWACRNYGFAIWHERRRWC